VQKKVQVLFVFIDDIASQHKDPGSFFHSEHFFTQNVLLIFQKVLKKMSIFEEKNFSGFHLGHVHCIFLLFTRVGNTCNAGLGFALLLMFLLQTPRSLPKLQFTP
jgi:hypothetical protein